MESIALARTFSPLWVSWESWGMGVAVGLCRLPCVARTGDTWLSARHPEDFDIMIRVLYAKKVDSN